GERLRGALRRERGAVRALARLDRDRGLPGDAPGRAAALAGAGGARGEGGRGGTPAPVPRARRRALRPPLPARRGLRRRGPERGVRAHVRAAGAHGPEGVPAPRRLAQELYAPAGRGARRTAAAPNSAAPVRISAARPGSGTGLS